MDFGKDESRATLSKSLSLIQKTIHQLKRIDRGLFPTPTTEDARTLLLDILVSLSNPGSHEPMSSVVLYNRLFALQEMVNTVGQSATDRISWPLVRYCDEFWTNFFGKSGPRIFYSLIDEHNYSVRRYSKRVAQLLDGLLPPSEISALVKGSEIYCLQLSSSEGENLPLYANIGHEFGHAVYDHHANDINDILSASLRPIMPKIQKGLDDSDKQQAPRRYKRTARILACIAEEIFCDIVGTLLMGPAFLLSLFEISWGQDRHQWPITLSPDVARIISYPSFHFRLDLINTIGQIDKFYEESKKEFLKLKSQPLKSIAACLASIPKKHDSDVIAIRPQSDPDSRIIQAVLTQHFSEVKQCYQAFIKSCQQSLTKWHKFDSPVAQVSEIAELLIRLEDNILPNVIPNGTILGRRATFPAILNASALYRMHVLGSFDGKEAERLYRDVGTLERLTGKAFEVTFVQKQYEAWGHL